MKPIKSQKFDLSIFFWCNMEKERCRFENVIKGEILGFFFFSPKCSQFVSMLNSVWLYKNKYYFDVYFRKKIRPLIWALTFFLHWEFQFRNKLKLYRLFIFTISAVQRFWVKALNSSATWSEMYFWKRKSIF